MHYYQVKYQKPNFIYQERLPSHPTPPDASSRVEKPSETSLESLKKYLKNTPEIITGDYHENAQRKKALLALEEQLTLTLSRDPLYSELVTLSELIRGMDRLHRAKYYIDFVREDAENIIKDPEYMAKHPEDILTFNNVDGGIRIYKQLTDAVNSYASSRSSAFNPIIEKYLHPLAISYLNDNIFNGRLKENLQRDKGETFAAIERAKAILEKRGETPEKRMQSLRKRLRENPNILKPGDTTLQQFIDFITSGPAKRKDDTLLDRVRKLKYLRDHLALTDLDYLAGRLMILRTDARDLKIGDPSVDIPSVPIFLQETLTLAENLLGQNSEYRRLVLSSQDLLHPSVIQFIKDSPPLRELYELKREIDKYLPKR